MRLRIKASISPLHVVLYEPEIPQNTGNIARLCAATGADLHLVGHLGFRIDEKAVRRAGLDYWHLVKVTHHNTLDECLDSISTPNPPVFLLTTRAEESFVKAPFVPGSVLIFGSESKGVPKEIRERFKQNCYGIPTKPQSVRSLNISNSVAIVVYEALKNTGALDAVFLD